MVGGGGSCRDQPDSTLCWPLGQGHLASWWPHFTGSASQVQASAPPQGQGGEGLLKALATWGSWSRELVPREAPPTTCLEQRLLPE